MLHYLDAFLSNLLYQTYLPESNYELEIMEWKQNDMFKCFFFEYLIIKQILLIHGITVSSTGWIFN